MRRGDDGAAVVDFVLVSVLVLSLFLIVFQVGVAPARQQRSLKTLNPFAKDAHVM